LVLALVACGQADRQDARTTHDAPSATSPRGPDNLVLRIPRTGGSARVYAYPRLDTVVWSTRGAPAPARVLAFDDEAGRVAYVDAKGLPTRVDFRQGAAYSAAKTRLTGLSSTDGTEIYAITAEGSVERYAPTGTWQWKPPVAARAVFPQPDGTLLALGERNGSSVVWRVRPPATTVSDSVVLPKVDRTLSTQVGDRLYLASGEHLTGLLTRTMHRSPDITFRAPIELLDATPSGDRVFVVTKASTAIEVVDRYQAKLGDPIEIGRNVSEMRMDPLGRYLLVRTERADSAIVVALGTNRVMGAVATEWRSDLPFVAPDGALALAQGADVIIADGETLQQRSRVKGGAADFWYPFRWTGFRPRDAKLDQPVEFAGQPVDSTGTADSVAVAQDSVGAPVVLPRPVVPPPRDSAVHRTGGFTVSFAAFPVAEPARELAARIRVGNDHARVATAMNAGTAIFRVVLGPYPTREEADRVGRESRQSYWVYEGGP
jgi:cell division septation protein DedD